MYHTLKKKYCAYSNTKLTIRRDVVRKISKVTREKRLDIIQNKVFLSQAKLSLVVRAIPVLEIVKNMVATQILLAAIVILVAMGTIRDNRDNLYIFS